MTPVVTGRTPRRPCPCFGPSPVRPPSPVSNPAVQSQVHRRSVHVRTVRYGCHTGWTFLPLTPGRRRRRGGSPRRRWGRVRHGPVGPHLRHTGRDSWVVLIPKFSRPIPGPYPCFETFHPSDTPLTGRGGWSVEVSEPTRLPRRVPSLLVSVGAPVVGGCLVVVLSAGPWQGLCLSHPWTLPSRAQKDPRAEEGVGKETRRLCLSCGAGDSGWTGKDPGHKVLGGRSPRTWGHGRTRYGR